MCETTHSLRGPAVPRPRASDPKRVWKPFRCRSVQAHARHLKLNSAVGSQPLKSSSSCSRSPPPAVSRHPPIPDGICTAGVFIIRTNSAPAEGARRSGREQGGAWALAGASHAHVAIRIHVQTVIPEHSGASLATSSAHTLSRLAADQIPIAALPPGKWHGHSNSPY